MSKKISAADNQTGQADKRDITATNFTSNDSEEKRGVDTNLGSANGPFYNPDREAFKVINRDAGHLAAQVGIEKLLPADFQKTELYSLDSTHQVLAFYDNNVLVREIQIEYTATGWIIEEYNGALLLSDDSSFLLLSDGVSLLLFGA
jgi:hypothetical protein